MPDMLAWWSPFNPALLRESVPWVHRWSWFMRFAVAITNAWASFVQRAQFIIYTACLPSPSNREPFEESSVNKQNVCRCNAKTRRCSILNPKLSFSVFAQRAAWCGGVESTLWHTQLLYNCRFEACASICSHQPEQRAAVGVCVIA
jgi:hypothetical protein